MKHSFKRALSLVLALIMALSCMSVGAFATNKTVNVDSQEELNNAVSSAQEGDTITIGTAGKYTFPAFSKNITIKGNVDGVVFEYASVYEGNIVSLSGGATFENITLTITGGDNYYGFKHSGKIVMNGCTLNGKLFSYGDMTFESCTFNAPGTTASGIDGADYSMWVYGGGTVSYNNCTFNGAGKFLHLYQEASEQHTVNVTGCTFDNANNAAKKAALNVKATCGEIPLNYTVNITGTNTLTGAFPAAGTTGTGNDGDLYVISGLVQVDDIKEGVNSSIIVNIDDTQVYPEVTTPVVAQIGTIEYPSLAAAVVAANDSATPVEIDILADCDVGSEYTMKNPLVFTNVGGTLDLNGHIITVAGGNSTTNGNFSFVIQANNATVKNGSIFSGTHMGKTTGWDSYVLVVNDCDGVNLTGLTMHGGLSIGGSQDDWGTTDSPKAGITYQHGADKATNVTITDCDITSGDYYAVCSQMNSSATIVSGTYTANSGYSGSRVIHGYFVNTDGPQGYITVTGGTFNGAIESSNATWVVLQGGTYSVKPVSGLIGSGYVAYANGNGTWTVAPAVAKIGETVYPTLQAAIDAAQNSNTITLLDDVALTATQEINKNLTINLNGKNITATDARALWVKSGEVEITGTGTISANGDNLAASSSVIRVGDSAANTSKAKLTVGQNVTVSSTKCYGVTAFGVNNTDGDLATADITLVINGTVAVSGVQAAVSGNGTSTLSATTMTINGTVSATQDYAIYHPGKGTLTVNGTVTGLGGIEAKGGTVTVNSGATVTATADKQTHTAYNNGASTSGYAIAAVSNPNYAGDPTVNIDGATISGKAIILADFDAQNVGTVTAKSNTIATDPDFAWAATGTEGEYKLVELTAVAQIGNVPYTSLQAAFNAATNGNTITLLADVTLSDRVFVNAGANPAYAGTNKRYATTSENKAITLDLNGHSITSSSNIALAGGSLTITGTGTGTISTTASGLAPIEVRGTGDLTNKRTLTIDSGVTLTGPEYGLNVFGSNDAQINKIEVNVNGTIKGCMFVLGNLKNTANDIVINVNGGATVSTDLPGSNNSDQAIANNGYATVNIKSGAIVTGKSTGVEVRAGTLNIENDATVTGNGAVTASSPNGDGCTTTGAGVAVAQHTTKLPTTLNITGGTITGKTALYITNPQSNETLNVSASVSGGTFNGGVNTEVYSTTTGKAVESKDDRVTGFITGGIYSTEPDSSYVASGYKAANLTSGINAGKYQVGIVTVTPTETTGTIEGASPSTQVTYTVNTVVKENEDANAKTIESKTALSVTVAGTTEETSYQSDAGTAPAALSSIKDNATLSNIVTDAIEAAGASITSTTETANITIQIAKSAADTTVANKVTYEVHPEAIIRVNDAVVGTVELSNSQLAENATFSFKLYAKSITDVNSGDKIKVTHIHEDGTSEELGPYEVDTYGYITVTGVSSFSDFELEKVTFDTTHYADYGYTLSLEDSINIVFNVKNLKVGNPSDYTVEYTFKGEKGSTTLSNTGLNSITVASCAAKEMGEVVHINVKYKGNTVKSVDLSVKGYCDSYIANNSSNPSKQYLVNLCKATLDYGRYAQETFNYKTNSLVNNGSDYFTNANITVPTYSYSKVGTRPYGITDESASLITTSATQLVVYFKYSGETTGYTVKVGDWNEKTGTIDHESDVSNWTTENGKIKVVITGIAAKNLGVKKAVTISYGANSYLLKFSPVDYMGLQVNHFGSQVNINRAFYNYYVKAADYFAHK